MQFGSWTVPLLPLAAVVGASALVLLVLWGVWRVRRQPTPAPLPVSPPDHSADEPCAADWTGEAAGGPADPPRPPRARTVADVVAEQGVDTGPLPVTAAAGSTVSGAMTAGSTMASSAVVTGSTVSGSTVSASTVAGSTVAGSAAAPDRAAAPRAGRHATSDDRQAPEDLSAPADERPDPAAPTRTGPAGAARGTARVGATTDTPAAGSGGADESGRPDRGGVPVGGVRTAEHGEHTERAGGAEGSRYREDTEQAGRDAEAGDVEHPGGGLAATAAALRRRARPYPGTTPATGPAAGDVPETGSAQTGGEQPGNRQPGDRETGHREIGDRADVRETRPEGTGPGPDATGAPPSPAPRLRAVDEDAGGPHGSTTAPRHPEPGPAAGTHVAAERTGPTQRNTGPVAPGPDGDPTAPLPPWSVERTVPPAQDLPTGDPVGERAADGPGASDTGASDTGAADTGAADTGAADTGAADTGAADTGTPDAGAPGAGASGAATADVTGAPESVSRAVQQALAARAVRRARLRPGPDDPPGDEQQELPLSVVPSRPSAPVAADDARDRLLSVLIADPARAVDATIRLDDSRNSIEELGDVLRRRRAELAGAVHHLRDCGLDPAQIGRLAGMAVDDVRAILDGEDAR